jgi:hypothetical protein
MSYEKLLPVAAFRGFLLSKHTSSVSDAGEAAMLTEVTGLKTRGYTDTRTNQPKLAHELHFIVPGFMEAPSKGRCTNAVSCQGVHHAEFVQNGPGVYDLKTEVRKTRAGAFEAVSAFKFAGPVARFQVDKDGAIIARA